MGEYEILGSYVAFALFVFLGAVLWNKYRKTIMRRLHLREYRHPRGGDHAPQPH
jgi:hypothetical protein